MTSRGAAAVDDGSSNFTVLAAWLGVSAAGVGCEEAAGSSGGGAAPTATTDAPGGP